MNLQKTVQQALENDLAPGQKVLLAISGGPDSVVLAHALKSLSYPMCWGHVNHQMRPGAARDASFVARLAKKWGIPCRVVRVNVPRWAKQEHRGLEEAARTLRYDVLGRLARRWRCSSVLTAHTADDQAETVLMNFLRGAGSAGLAGIPSKRPLVSQVSLLRPLLRVPRKAILDYLQVHQLKSCQDPTNRDTCFTRNLIRLDLFPRLEKQFPGVRDRLAQGAVIFRDEEAFWAALLAREMPKTVRKDARKTSVDLRRLLGYHKTLARRLLRACVGGLTLDETERLFILASSSAKDRTCSLPGGWMAQKKGRTLIFKKRLP